jgi:hypothetical protein
MKRHFAGGLLLVGILATSVAADMTEGYLDVFIAKVKMGKRGEFDSINKRFVEMNRKNKGDTWLAYEIAYGQPNTVYFVSTRTSYGAAEAGTKAFEGALTESLGKPGMQKMFDAFDATVDSERTELRRRRWDLTANAPRDMSAYYQLIGGARYLRLITLHTRAGKAPEFESLLKRSKEAQERNNAGVPFLVSQAVAGQSTGTFYIANLVKSLADLDNIKTLQQVMGSSWESYQRESAEVLAGTDIAIGRFRPELSNPPEEVASVDPKFWRPAPTPPVSAKPADAKK